MGKSTTRLSRTCRTWRRASRRLSGGRSSSNRSSSRTWRYVCNASTKALRIFPPVSRNDRMCTKDWQDEGLFIPKGASSHLYFLSLLRNHPRYDDQHPHVRDPPQPRVLARARAFQTREVSTCHLS